MLDAVLLEDVRYAFRSLAIAPAITAVAVATLAIGSGAATTTFAVVDRILLEPLAYPEADELVAVWLDAPGSTWSLDRGGLPLSGPMFLTFAEQNRVFENLGVWTPGTATIIGEGEPEEVPRIAVTVGVLEALGVQPLLGRWLSAREPGDVPQIMLSYGYWQRRFGGDARVVGRTLNVNARAARDRRGHAAGVSHSRHRSRSAVGPDAVRAHRAGAGELLVFRGRAPEARDDRRSTRTPTSRA